MAFGASNKIALNGRQFRSIKRGVHVIEGAGVRGPVGGGEAGERKRG